MTIGSVLDVFLRTDQEDAQRIGSGLVIHPQLVQLDASAARVIRERPRHSAELEVRDEAHQLAGVHRIRPGLVGFEAAAQVVADEVGMQLLPIDGDLVFLEMVVADPECRVCADPWWCKIVCTSSCSKC